VDIGEEIGSFEDMEPMTPPTPEKPSVPVEAPMPLVPTTPLPAPAPTPVPSLPSLNIKPITAGKINDTKVTMHQAIMGNQKPSELKEMVARNVGSDLESNADFSEFVRTQREIGKPYWRDMDPKLKKGHIQDEVSGWVHHWAAGSQSPNSIAMQLAAREELGATTAAMSHWKDDALTKGREIYNANKKALRALVRAQYDSTQAWLKEQKIEELFLFRGQGWLDGKEPNTLGEWNNKIRTVKMKSQPLMSMTTDWEIAKGFANGDNLAIVGAHVPAKRIFSMPRTGLGCANESEFVVLGGEEEVSALMWDHRVRPDRIPQSFEAATNKPPKKGP
jgi:hypothetical protein